MRERERERERERKRERKRERERERGVREKEKTDVPKLYAYNECEHSVAWIQISKIEHKS